MALPQKARSRRLPRERQLDGLDRQIMAMLRDNGRASIADVSRRLNLSQGAVFVRLQRLQEERYIRGYHAELDYGRVGRPVVAYIVLRVQETQGDLSRLVGALAAIPQIERIVWVTGEFDAVITVRARDTQHLEEIINKIRQTHGIYTRTMVALSTPLERYGAEFDGDQYPLAETRTEIE